MSNKAFQTIESEVLGEQVIILTDINAIDEALKAHKVIYKPEEIEALDGASDETLREVHKLKKFFRGWICGPKVLV
jgi:hypothetical protein